MYQALYRKWRPHTFDDVVGQEHITETLKRQVESGRLSHAYLFVGTRGTGKTTCAKILAKAINCEHPQNGSPCNKCPSCLGIESGAILDVTELDAASNNGVDDVRALRDEAVFSPTSVRKRVYIIDEVHMLSKPAFNALLKILEEPPEHLVFILATTELHKVLPTILSRCQRFSFKRLLPKDIKARLQYIASQENIDLAEDGAELLAHMADGAMRDALSLLDQCGTQNRIDAEFVSQAIGLAGSRDTLELFELLKAGDIAAVLSKTDTLYKNGKDMSAVIDELCSLVRDILLYKLSPASYEALISGLFDTVSIKNLASGFSGRKAITWLEIMNNSSASLAEASSVRLGVELCMIRLCKDTPADDSSVIARIEALEEKIAGGNFASAPKNPGKSENEPKPAPAKAEEPAPLKPEAPVKPEKEESEAEAEELITAEEPAVPEGDLWDSILSEAQKIGLDQGYFFVLSEKSQVNASISGNKLTVICKNMFASTLVNNSEVNSILKKAAFKVLGTNPVITVTQDDGKSAPKKDKLDALSKFDIINFE